MEKQIAALICPECVQAHDEQHYPKKPGIYYCVHNKTVALKRKKGMGWILMTGIDPCDVKRMTGAGFEQVANEFLH